jgi:hypothetical protein
MKEYVLKNQEELAVEIYMPESDRIPNVDYCFHAGDWALCYPLRSTARAILNAAEGLAEATMSMNDWNNSHSPKRYFRFEFSSKENLRIFWALVREYL